MRTPVLARFHWPGRGGARGRPGAGCVDGSGQAVF
jgi:hypothetical protein